MFFTPKGTIDLKYYQKIYTLCTEKQWTAYITCDTLTSQQYLQLIYNTKYETKESQELFRHSILNMSNISQHVSLLSIIGFSYTDYNNQPFPTVFFEFYPNRSLSDFLSSGQIFTSTQIFIILLGIANGLNHAYKNFFVHGNVNLKNIFLDDKFMPKIYGFKEADGNSNTTTKQDDIFNYGQIAVQLFQESRNEWHQKFVSSCMSEYRIQRPDFGQIVIDLLSHKNEFHDINNDEVERYLKMTERCINWHHRLLKEEAEKGDISSMFIYGTFLSDETMNKQEALKYYKKAADCGFVPAMFNYAFMLSKGDGVQINKQEAAKYYLKAIDGGNKTAMFNYAHMLFNGDGVKTNKCEAARLYKLAADNGNAKAMFNYAQVLYKGEGVKIDKIEAARYFKLAAQQGNVKAMSSYAVLNLKGEGVKENKEEAARFFKMAADFGQIDAMIKFAEMIEKGDGVVANKEEAAKYFKKAADSGNTEAYERYKKIVSF